jgi:hypothetical protein
MKKTAFAILIFLILLGGNIRLYSQDLNPIQTVVPFLTIAPDSRAGGMGDAGVATSPDIYSMHWNPAKYAFIKGNGGAALSYTPWLRNLVPDINIAYLSGYKRIDAKQVVSASLIYSSLGDVPFTDDFGNLERVFKPNEFSLDAAYSRLFSEHFSGGIAFRFIYSNLTGGSTSGGGIATKPGTSFAADISGYYQTNINLFSKNGELAFGLNLSNIGTKMSYSDAPEADFIPMNMRLGTAGSIYLDPHNKLTLTLDLNKLLVPTPPIYDNGVIIHGKDPNISVPLAMIQSFYDAPGGFKEEMHEISYATGIEYWYNEQFAVRGGYYYQNQTKGPGKYFTLGAGFKINIFALDFSYLIPTTQNNPLARTLRFSLAFVFNNPKGGESKSKG